MSREYHFHTKGDKDQTRKELDMLDGVIQTMVTDEEEINITWKANNDPLQKVADILQDGNYDDGISLLELFLSDDPNDTTVLFNLGMAYSDRGELDLSIELLRKLIGKEPEHTNGLVALGVALLRANKTEEGIHELQAAVSQEPGNVWARRNLGVGLMQAGRSTDALEHLRRAVELKADDAAAWFGYGQALELNGDWRQADTAYRKALDLDEFGEIAERARAARTALAEKSFRGDTQSLRMDAVMYLLGALEKFENLSPEQVRQIGFEIAMLGTRGLDVNSPETKYTLKSLEGNFSGLQLVCIEYAAFMQFAPEQNIGFDLSAEYETALKLFGGSKTVPQVG